MLQNPPSQGRSVLPSPRRARRRIKWRKKKPRKKRWKQRDLPLHHHHYPPPHLLYLVLPHMYPIHHLIIIFHQFLHCLPLILPHNTKHNLPTSASIPMSISVIILHFPPFIITNNNNNILLVHHISNTTTPPCILAIALFLSVPSLLLRSAAFLLLPPAILNIHQTSSTIADKQSKFLPNPPVIIRAILILFPTLQTMWWICSSALLQWVHHLPF